MMKAGTTFPSPLLFALLASDLVARIHAFLPPISAFPAFRKDAPTSAELPRSAFLPLDFRYSAPAFCSPVLSARTSAAESTERAPVVARARWKRDFLPDGASLLKEMQPEEMLREWFPLSFEAYLDPTLPNPVLHMGRRMAVWKGSSGWVAQDDMCPHKLAPLSDGSIVGDGVALRCSYHGWQFDGCGTCSLIPSLPRNTSIPPKCAVRSYPVRRNGNMLWIWMDPSVEPDEDDPRLSHGAWELGNGYQRELAYSWDYLFENILDPTHVAYSHFGVGKEFNRTEVDEIRDEHVTNLETRYNNAGVQLKFNRTVNGRNANETWDFVYPGIWFLRRGGSDRGPGGVIMASPIDAHNTRLMSTQYSPEPVKKPETLRTKLMRPIFTFLFHTALNRFFNSDAFLIRYQQEMVASSDNALDPLLDYELASPADKGTVAFRRWHSKRLGGLVPMARALVPGSKSERGSIAQPTVPRSKMVTREQAADPWEQHSKNCPTCRGVHNFARRVRLGSAVLAALAAMLCPVVGSAASFASSLALGYLSLRAHKLILTFHKKGHVHGKMG